MPLLDIFASDMFSSVGLTLAIENLPYKPTKIGDMGLFKFEGIPGLHVTIENKTGTLFLVPSAARGAQPTWPKPEGRNVRSILVGHHPINETVMADDVIGVRLFGSTDQNESVVTVVNNKLQKLKDAMATTFEWLKMGALRGIVLDADGSTVLYNWFTEFGITQPEVEFDFETPGDLKMTALDVIEAIESALNGAPYDHIHAFVGNTWWRALLTNAEVKEAYDDQSEWRRTQQRTGFEYADIFWEPYRGNVNGNPWQPLAEAQFFPVGVPDLFWHYGAPAPFMETVNTIGKDMYAKQERMEFDTGVKLHCNSSPLMLCTRPAALVKGTMAEPEAFTAPEDMEQQPADGGEFQPFEPQAQQPANSY